MSAVAERVDERRRAWHRGLAPRIALVAIAGTAGVVGWLATRKPAAPPAPAVSRLALAAKRPLEARLSWGAAAAYRDYDVPRANEPAREAVSLATLAEVEKAGDLHGVGVLSLLDGERHQAATYLARATESADVLADRAALELAEGQPGRALALLDGVVTSHPDHAAALWNRGLALRDLGLVQAAAQAFHAVAAKHEPGWAEEAAHRATTLDAQAESLAKRADRITTSELTVADASAQPGYARGILYDRIRSATSPAELARLQPLVDAIDGADHDTAMHDAVARARANLHPELAKQYGDMLRALAVEGGYATPKAGDPAVPTGAERARFLAALRAAHADDLLIGVLMKLSDDRSAANDNEISELAKLAAASPDPWINVLGFQQQVQVALRHDDLIGAEAVLLRARQRCAEGAPAFRCVTIGRLAGKLYLWWLRLPEARTALGDAWTLATRAGEWYLQADLLPYLAQLALVDSDAEGSSLPLLRAYTTEVELRNPSCEATLVGKTLRAQVLVNHLDFAAARAELVAAPCRDAIDPGKAAGNLFVRAELAAQRGDPTEIAALRTEIATLRAAKATAPAQQILLDHAEGRIVIDGDPKAGEALLHRAISRAGELPASAVEDRRAAAWSYAVMAIAAAKRGDGDAMLAVIAEEQGLTVPKTCAVAIAVDDQRRAFAARDPGGKPVVHYDDGRTQILIDPATLVPAEITSALAGCPAIDVIARPPIHGMARLFAPAIAWGYLARRGGPVAPTSAKKLVIADVEPPAKLELPRLQTWATDGEVISGPRATPDRVLTAIGNAGEVVVHAHGLVDVAEPGASYLALSQDPSGKFALTTADVHKARFATAPVIVLAACRASQAAPVFHETWSLPAAFVFAGARAVVASTGPIPDADASPFFDAMRAKITSGVAVAAALRDVRQDWLTQHRGDWVRDVIVFE